MNSKTVLLFILLIMLPSAMLGARFIVPVEGTPGIIEVPGDYETIQAAIDAADPGDIIQVASETYYEHVVVNKSLTIVGEDRSTTIIDGSGTEIVVRVNASDVEIRGFTIQNGGDSPNSGIRMGSCVRNTIRDCIIRNNAFGIDLLNSNDSIIVGTTIMDSSWTGIRFRDSSNNEVHNNIITNNSFGIDITEPSLSNIFYHNNFIDNLNDAWSYAVTTRWDNGAEGNYWSNYTGVDDGSNNRTAVDGIGDTHLPHFGGYQAMDYYPLMEPWSPHTVFYAGTWDGVPYYVTTFSNSTVSTRSFNFSVSLMRIGFYATSGASGFCNVTIPQELLDGVFRVLIDGEQIPTPSITVTPTHSSLYFTYSQGTHYVEVYGTTVIPEFPGSIPLTTFLVALAILLVFIRRRSRVFKWNHNLEV
jgi:parallel beta-helix repeat protein